MHTSRLLFLLLAAATPAVGCGGREGTSTSSTSNNAGGSPAAGSGGAGGDAGSASGSGGGGAGGAGVPSCDASKQQQPSGEEALCFGVDGKSQTIPAHEFEGGPFEIDCPALVRQPGAACPGGEAACGYNFCGKLTLPYGAGQAQGDRCCYQAVRCNYPNACGRPLRVEGGLRVAPLARVKKSRRTSRPSRLARW